MSRFEQHWRRRFVERGTLMDDDAGIAGWTRTGLATRVRQFDRLWRETPGALGVWLDIGCGAGTYTRLLHEQGYSMIGMDYSVPLQWLLEIRPTRALLRHLPALGAMLGHSFIVRARRPT